MCLFPRMPSEDRRLNSALYTLVFSAISAAPRNQKHSRGADKFDAQHMMVSCFYRAAAGSQV